MMPGTNLEVIRKVVPVHRAFLSLEHDPVAFGQGVKIGAPGIRSVTSRDRKEYMARILLQKTKPMITPRRGEGG